MKEEYKIYLLFWGPILIFAIFSFLFLLNYQRSLTPISQIKLSENYIEVVNQLNSLNYLKPFKLLEKEDIVIDPFSTGFKETLLKPGISIKEKPSKIFHLSIIYIEGTKKICIINNNRFKEGDILEKDIKIKKVGDYYVDLQIKGKTKRLLLGQTLSF